MRIAQDADGRDGIDALPEHVAGIVVAADAGAGDGAQLQHGFGAVDDEAGMHLDRDLDAVIGGELALLGPVGDDLLLPLPLQDLEVIRAATGR